MRVYNALTFLILFIYIGVLSLFICLIYGTQRTLVFLKQNGIYLNNNKNE